jgi:hypothetical protein
MSALAFAATPPPHDEHRDHVVHRLAHAIYGLIVLAAVVGELSTHDEDMRTAIVLVGAGALVLVFAHSYSQLVASASMEPKRPHLTIIVSTVVDQLALGIPAAVAVGVFALGEAGVITDRAAYNIVIAGTLATLFGVGATIGRHRGKGWVWSTAAGLGNLAVGLVIIGIEAAAAH